MTDLDLGYSISNKVFYLLNTYGDNITYAVQQEMSGDYIDSSHPSKGKVKTTTVYPVLAFESPYKESAINGTSIKSSDTRLYVSTENFAVTPDETDKVIEYVGGGETLIWEVVKVKTHKTYNKSVYYELQLRK